MAVNGSAEKFVYVTGCDTGFGAILVRQLDALGFSVVAGVYLPKTVDQLKSECSKNVHPVQVDVSDEKSVDKCAQLIKELVASNNGQLVGLVNNAGILVQPGPTEWTPNDAYRRMFAVNVMGTVMTTRALLPLLRKSQGRIVNVASIAGRVGFPSEPAYCMSKYGVEGYCEVLRKDLLPWGVSVHIIEPGVFNKTGLYDQFQTGLDDLWEKLAPEIKADYGEEYYKKLRARMGEVLIKSGNTNSELVPIAMIHALTAERPKYRYKVGNDSKYIVSVLEKCHESTQDSVLARKLGVPKAAPFNGRELLQKRYDQGWTRFLITVAILLVVLNKLRK